MGSNGNDVQRLLLEIQPKELKFVFESKKQSSCSVRLTNITYHYVAFKIKTTAPQSYCVRPNIGILEPKSTCEFTVTMQAQKVAPPNMICKDKFLIQSVVVPAGTSDKDITPAMFVKDVGKYVNEVKLRVALISPSEPEVVSPISGGLKQDPFFGDADPVNRVTTRLPSQKVANGVEFKKHNDRLVNTARDVELKPEKDNVDHQKSKPSEPVEFKKLNDPVFNTGNEAEMKPNAAMFENQETKLSEMPNVAELLPILDFFEGARLKTAKGGELKVEKDAVFDDQQKEIKGLDFPQAKDEQPITSQGEKELELVRDMEEIKSKLGVLESKLNEAELIISNLTDERRLNTEERTKLQEELALLRSRTVVKRVQIGFPLLYVVMVALISIVFGYLLHA